MPAPKLYTDEERRQRAREASKRCQADPVKRAAKHASTKAWKAEHPEHQLFKACKNSAKSRGQTCELTIEDVRNLIRPMQCSMTGVQLSWRWEGPGTNPWAPSLDRLDNSKGYTLDNVRLVCWAFNLARGVWHDEVFHKLAIGYARKTT